MTTQRTIVSCLLAIAMLALSAAPLFAGFYTIPWFIVSVFSERYVEAIPYARFLWLGSAAFFPLTYLGNTLKAQQVTFVPYLNTIQGLTLVALLVGLVPVLGVWGAVCARIGSTMVLSIAFAVTFAIRLRRESQHPNLPIQTAGS